MLNRLHYQWPAKLIIMIIITQIIMIGHLGNLRINFGAMSKHTTVNILTPCPKAELQSKLSQQLCQNQLYISLNSIFTTISIMLSSKYIVPMDYITRYTMLVYDIYKPPKN